MRTIALPAVGFAIAACAALDETSTTSSTTAARYADATVAEATAAEAVAVEAVAVEAAAQDAVSVEAAAEIEPGAVVDANRTLEEQVVCSYVEVTGTRIRRQQCHVPLSAQEEALQAAFTQAQLDHLRREAEWEERRRLEAMGAVAPPQPLPAPPAGDPASD